MKLRFLLPALLLCSLGFPADPPKAPPQPCALQHWPLSWACRVKALSLAAGQVKPAGGAGLGGGGILSVNPGANTGPTVTFAVGTAGTDFAVAGGTNTVTFNLPAADATHTGKLAAADWTTFNAKQAALSTSAAVTNQFITAFTAPNTFTRAQPSCGNLSDAASGCSTVAVATSAAVSNQFLTGFTAPNTFTRAQPTLANIAAGSAPTGTFDFSGSTLLEVPVAAGATTTVSGAVAVDPTANNLHVGLGSADSIAPTVTVTPTTGNCVKWSITSGRLKLDDAGAACGTGSGAAFQGPFPLENGIPDATGHAFYYSRSSADGYTSPFVDAGWEFDSTNSVADISFKFRYPHTLPSGTAKIILSNIVSLDGTSGHTMTLREGDAQVTTVGNPASYTFTATQTYTTTTGALTTPVDLTFVLNDTPVADKEVQIIIERTATSGLTANVHFGGVYLEFQ
jgi:hypothetical protein